MDTKMRQIIYTLLLVAVIHYFYWVIVALFAVQISPSIFISLGFSPITSNILIEILFSLFAGSIIGLPFGIIINNKPMLCAATASIIEFFILMFTYSFTLNWLHYLSYSLMIISITIFTYVGSRIKKTPNKPKHSDSVNAADV